MIVHCCVRRMLYYTSFCSRFLRASTECEWHNGSIDIGGGMHNRSWWCKSWS